MADSSYTPPEIWDPETVSGGKFSNINKPTAGARHEKDLPVGAHPFQLYSLATPNGQKVTIMFEELLAAGHEAAEYDAWLIDIGGGDQFGSGFVEANPNSKIPALVDRRGTPPIRVFESAHILQYLSEAFGAFLPEDRAKRTEALNWLYWSAGAAPFLGGGFGHFFAYAPEKLEYPIDRYAMEAKRQLDLLDKRLAEWAFVGGDSYSIADMAIFPWWGALALDQIYEGAGTFLKVEDYKNLRRWADQIAGRGPVIRGRRVNKKDEDGIEERHDAGDLD